MPMEPIPGVGVRLRSVRYPAEEILARLRLASPPVIARVEQDEVVLDVRTLQKGEDCLLCRAIERAFVLAAIIDRGGRWVDGYCWRYAIN